MRRISSISRSGLRGSACIPVVLALASLASAAAADPVADFYRGKTVSVFIGFGPGGGYDMSARTLARHMSRHLPGEPAFVARNMPGAGSLRAANYIYSVAPKDGTEFGLFGRTAPLDPLLGVKGADFDALKFTWLGSTSNEVSTCVSWATSPVKTFEDVRKTELSVGSAGLTSPSATFPNLFNGVLGTKFKVVSGYPGSANILTALEAGELGGFCSWGWAPMKATRPDWLRDGKVNVLVQIGLRKHADHPDVPLVLEFAKTDEERKVLQFVVAPQTFARPFAAPPGLPPERAAALRKAFADTVKDPAFVAEAEKLKLEPDLVTGEEVEQLIRELYATPKPIVERAIAAIKAR